MGKWQALVAGVAGGAAGTTALNAVTYLDMAVRGRPASSTPEKTVETLADRAGIAIPGDGDHRKNRLAGLGPLSGLATGVTVGAVLGLGRSAGLRGNLPLVGIFTGAAAMGATDGSMAALGVSHPTTWTASAWLSDAIPHLAYGLVTAAVVRRLDRA